MDAALQGKPKTHKFPTQSVFNDNVLLFSEIPDRAKWKKSPNTRRINIKLLNLRGK